jgi:hypothetical protein
MIALAVIIVRQRSTELHGAPAAALTPASLSAGGNGDPGDPDSTSMSLRLGGVTLRVAHADRYVLSVRKKRFLELDTDRNGLWVSCEVKAVSRGLMYSPQGGHIRRNSLRFPTDSLPRPDAHTIVLGSPGQETFGVRYVNRRTIDVIGTFYTGDGDDTLVIRRGGGIYWTGDGPPPGSTIDLRHFGSGTIDFEQSGMIRILH